MFLKHSIWQVVPILGDYLLAPVYSDTWLSSDITTVRYDSLKLLQWHTTPSLKPLQWSTTPSLKFLRGAWLPLSSCYSEAWLPLKFLCGAQLPLKLLRWSTTPSLSPVATVVHNSLSSCYSGAQFSLKFLQWRTTPSQAATVKHDSLSQATTVMHDSLPQVAAVNHNLNTMAKSQTTTNCPFARLHRDCLETTFTTSPTTSGWNVWPPVPPDATCVPLHLPQLLLTGTTFRLERVTSCSSWCYLCSSPPSSNWDYLLTGNPPVKSGKSSRSTQPPAKGSTLSLMR